MSEYQPPIPVDVPYFRGAWLVLGRELRAWFDAASGKLVLAGGFLGAGLLFAIELAGSGSSARPWPSRLPFLLVFFAPLTALLGRVWERNASVSELWRALPLEASQVRLGKLGAALGFYGVFLAGALPFPLALLALGRTDPASVLLGYLGAIVVGALFFVIARSRTSA